MSTAKPHRFSRLDWRLAFVLSVSTAAIACSAMDPVSPPPVDNRDAGTDSAPDFACLPDCYRQAFEFHQPTGACVAEAAPASTMDNSESWICFADDSRLHLVAMTNGGNVSITTDLRPPTGGAKRVEFLGTPQSGSYTVTDEAGAVLATATLTNYPGITIACDNMQLELDRTSPCGRAATAQLARAGVASETVARCSVGVCAH